MTPVQDILFRPFRLDIVNEMLWRGSRVLALRQKSFSLLRYLAEHPGQLVTKEELLKAVWPETRVSEIVLKVCIREVRQALGDQPHAPAYIETVQRRGYRFIRPVRRRERLPTRGRRRTQSITSERRNSEQDGELQGNMPPPCSAPAPRAPAINCIGRDAELTLLRTWLEKALSGERHLVFVTGEAGIGKTTLINAFLERVAADPSIWIARGQCIAHYGGGEAFLPVLEAVSRLCREPGRERLLWLLKQHAPLWLAQMPSLLTLQDRRRLQREVQQASRERMLREMADVVEALTAETPLVLVLDDVHWGDRATLDLLSFLSRREPARLLIIGAYRPEELCAGAHPLKGIKHELQSHSRCHHLPLTLLTVADVARYLAVRFPTNTFPSALALILHQRTEGNPLFIENVVEHLQATGVIAQNDGDWSLTTTVEAVQLEKPTTIQEIIEAHLDRLSPQEEQVLKVAGVAGVEFSTAALAAGLHAEEEAVEDWCEGLAQRKQFLRALGSEEWPDGTLTTRYEFIHALYQQGWYDRVTAGKRVQLHQRIGERIEQGYGARAAEAASELAVHFERGRDIRRAIHYHIQAALNAARHCSYQEVVNHLTRSIALLPHAPESAERTQQEHALLHALSTARMAPQGCACPAVEHACAHARLLCQYIQGASHSPSPSEDCIPFT